MLNLVFFSPEDLNIIKNGPSERRRFLDLELCQLNKIYLNQLTNYNKTLIQRNNLLKQISTNRNLMDTLYIWDSKQIEYGRGIIETRYKFLLRLNELVGEIHKRLTGGKEELILQYEPNVRAVDFEERLKKSLEKDLYLKMTHVGPHRDDMCFCWVQLTFVNMVPRGSKEQLHSPASLQKSTWSNLSLKKIPFYF